MYVYRRGLCMCIVTAYIWMLNYPKIPLLAVALKLPEAFDFATISSPKLLYRILYICLCMYIWWWHMWNVAALWHIYAKQMRLKLFNRPIRQHARAETFLPIPHHRLGWVGGVSTSYGIHSLMLLYCLYCWGDNLSNPLEWLDDSSICCCTSIQALSVSEWNGDWGWIWAGAVWCPNSYYNIYFVKTHHNKPHK